MDWSESLSNGALDFANAVTNPAKYSFDVANPTPSCANDYVVFTLPAGAGTQANVFAFNNLYVNDAGTGTCAGKTPTALFTYNGSQNAGPLNSSPVLSLDGTKIAFIENAASAQFHVLKWKAGNTAAVAGQPWNAAKLPNCATNGAVAPCEYSVVYSTHTATLSAPYVDYGSDTAYVTDDKGLVAAIHPVFGGGTPAVVFSQIVSKSAMTPPVYDSVSQNVFAGDAGGTLHYVRTTAQSAGKCATGNPPCLGVTALVATTGTPIYDAPLVDSSNGTVFVFSNSAPGGASRASVVQTNTTLSGSRVALFGPDGSQPIHAGTFTNNYYNNPATGLLYVCGANASNIPQLYAVTFTGSKMDAGAATFGPLAMATGAAGCSPLTEVYNQSTNKDYLLVGVSDKCSAAIAGGCLEEFDVTSGFPRAVTAAAAESGGTTGIIIDNVSNGASGNASQTNLYFGTLGTQACSTYTGGTSAAGNCLVKLTQTGLQ